MNTDPHEAVKRISHYYALLFSTLLFAHIRPMNTFTFSYSTSEATFADVAIKAGTGRAGAAGLPIDEQDYVKLGLF
jgi:hypothetical protein